MAIKRNNIRDIQKKKGGDKITCLTAYSAPVAKILDRYTDILLVGDSLGMVVYGMKSTLEVTTTMMCNHGKAVVRASEKALIVVDMPFGTYQETKEKAFRNAARIMKETGCAAVKFEGGVEMKETIKFLVERGIAVMAHIGLQPQSVNASGGYRFYGKNDAEKERIISDAIAVEQAGAFAVVLEGVVQNVADEVTKLLTIPTIGIGASVNCDGQVLVTDDMVGMFADDTPKFVKRYGDIANEIEKSAKKFVADVKDGSFPEDKHCVK